MQQCQHFSQYLFYHFSWSTKISTICQGLKLLWGNSMEVYEGQDNDSKVLTNAFQSQIFLVFLNFKKFQCYFRGYFYYFAVFCIFLFYTQMKKEQFFYLFFYLKNQTKKILFFLVHINIQIYTIIKQQMNFQGGFSKAYKQKGVHEFYQQKGNAYSNPHAYDIQRILRKKLGKPNPYIKLNSKILDLACGAGEATKPLLTFGYKNIKGTDPYTSTVYIANTKCQCDLYSFMDIIEDCYQGQYFDCVICSYAMHLCKESLLHDFCNKLSEIAGIFIIVSPHKLPVMKQTYGWGQLEAFVQDKIHFRVFKSLYERQEVAGEKEQEDAQKQHNLVEEKNIANDEDQNQKHQTKESKV